MSHPKTIKDRFFTTPELGKLLDVPIWKVIAYLEKGYFSASQKKASGHASRRLFTFDDILKAKAIHLFAQFGLSVRYLRQLSEHWDYGAGCTSSGLFVFSAGGFPVFKGSLDDFLKYDPFGEPVLTINLRKVEEKLIEDINLKLK